MIRQILLVGAALAFALAVLGTSVARISAQTATQDAEPAMVEEEAIEEEAMVEEEATEGAEPTVDYYLAYPGILPDHPLYFLKMIRDRIWLFLTTDVVKKAELYLLFADKRLGASQALIEGNKHDLGVSTATKAEKYLELAIGQAERAKQAGRDTAAFYETLSKATRKHEEVLLGVIDKVPQEARTVLESALDYAHRGYEQVSQAMMEE